MTEPEITPKEALMRLGASTAEAMVQVLETFLPSGIERGDVSVLEAGANPFANLPGGAVATSVSYVDGVTGANVFVLAPAGARALAGAMGVAPEGEADELSELELSAVAEATNQMMAAAAAAISVVLGQQIEISPPDTQVLEKGVNPASRYASAPHAISTTFLIGGEHARLIQLVPSGFVMRMARAIDDAAARTEGAGEGDGGPGESTVGLVDALSGINLRVWAELGRTRLPLGEALALPLGAVVSLDCAADAPVDLFVNGVRFAEGHLLVTDDGEWALRVEGLGNRRQGGVNQEQGALT
jgi:flagellar motor switch protein FliN/FliY